MNTLLIIILSIIQLPFLLEGWISFFLNSIIKALSKILFIIAIISFVWWPIDMLSGICWTVCECAKFKLAGKDLSFQEGLVLYMRNYPQL